MKTKPFDRSKGPVRCKGVVWQYSEAKQRWERAVLRVHGDRSQYWSLTTYVDSTKPFCLVCLSHRVEPQGIRVTPGQPDVETFYCQDCSTSTAVEL